MLIFIYFDCIFPFPGHDDVLFKKIQLEMRPIGNFLLLIILKKKIMSQDRFDTWLNCNKISKRFLVIYLMLLQFRIVSAGIK